MKDREDKIDYCKFVDDEMTKGGFRIQLADEYFVKTKLDDLLKHVNGIRNEYNTEYGWDEVDKQYLLNPLVDKWKYSFVILNQKDEICFLNFSSVYGDIIHNHCTYARKESRGMNFAKLHIIKLCQTGLDNGFTYMEGYWPKNNNRSIILFLKMGWKIESIVNNKKLLMKADLIHIQRKAYELILSGQKAER